MTRRQSQRATADPDGGTSRSRRRARSRRIPLPALAALLSAAVVAAGVGSLLLVGRQHGSAASTLPLASPSASGLGTGTGAATGSSGPTGSTAPSAPAPGAAGDVPLGLDAPYEYLGWGNPQPPEAVLAATGIRQITLGFITGDSGCTPAWDGSRPLTGGSDQSAVDTIRAHGGDVVVSFGGASGDRLAVACTTAAALAGAYGRVVDAYRLKAVDFDLENAEISSGPLRQRVIDALGLLHGTHPALRMYATVALGTTGPDAPELDLIHRGAAAHLELTGWVGMPFDFGQHDGSMAQASVTATDGLARVLADSGYGYSLDQAYRHTGLSSMNGDTDEADETVSKADFSVLLGYARAHHLARFTFWAVNRDRSCGAGLTKGDSCSGIAQQPYAFTELAAGYRG